MPGVRECHRYEWVAVMRTRMLRDDARALAVEDADGSAVKSDCKHLREASETSVSKLQCYVAQKVAFFL